VQQREGRRDELAEHSVLLHDQHPRSAACHACRKAKKASTHIPEVKQMHCWSSRLLACLLTLTDLESVVGRA
jgi:hypothetical protein